MQIRQEKGQNHDDVGNSLLYPGLAGNCDMDHHAEAMVGGWSGNKSL